MGGQAPVTAPSPSPPTVRGNPAKGPVDAREPSDGRPPRLPEGLRGGARGRQHERLPSPHEPGNRSASRGHRRHPWGRRGRRDRRERPGVVPRQWAGPDAGRLRHPPGSGGGPGRSPQPLGSARGGSRLHRPGQSIHHPDYRMWELVGPAGANPRTAPRPLSPTFGPEETFLGLDERYDGAVAIDASAGTIGQRPRPGGVGIGGPVPAAARGERPRRAVCGSRSTEYRVSPATSMRRTVMTPLSPSTATWPKNCRPSLGGWLGRHTPV